MVWLAQWIREHQEDARVFVITDRTELDEQIEGVFNGVGRRSTGPTGADLIAKPQSQRAMADLLPGPQVPGVDEDERAATRPRPSSSPSCNAKVPRGFRAKGNLFVFVDEAHRTESDKMHEAMKGLMPEAMFIGFTGTPLLKVDEETSIEAFGPFIHTYKFDEAVDVGVVLDLRYEARNIDQDLLLRRRSTPGSTPKLRA